MNRIIPRIGLLIPPRVSWARPATGLCSMVVTAWALEVTTRSSMGGLRGRARVGQDGRRMGSAVAQVEQRPLRPDLWQVVEVVGRRRRAGRPLERVRLPRIVAGDAAAAERDGDVDQPRDGAGGDDEAADRGGQVQLVPAGG